jgi:hypothetical protein
MRFFVGVTSAFGAGLLIGLGLGAILTEEKFRKEYEESAASMRRAREMTVEQPKEEPQDEPRPEKVVAEQTITTRVVDSTQSIEDYKPAEDNPYHHTVQEMNDTRGDFTYLTEDDYHQDDDGFTKSQIVVMMDGSEPIFIENGAQIKDWEEKVGSRILGDFYQLIPPGEPQVLYIRNNLTDVDYEVFRDQP